ncbi:hypothetical protein CAD93_22655 [Salmonella enterica subsp. enterica serovar Tennessee]|nr:hypothetical protein [Salmonella enterica subsp. enterica serovar Tennessee]
MSKLPSPDMVRRIEAAAAALIAAGTPNPTNVQVRDHLGGGSLATISPVMRAFRARQREQVREETLPLPPELAQLLTGQLTLLWQADAGALGAREQADIERDAALAKVAELESELAVLREVQTERDRLLQQVPGLQERMISLREEVVRQQTKNEHLTVQLQESRDEVKALRDSERALQQTLLTQAQAEQKDGKVTK